MTLNSYRNNPEYPDRYTRSKNWAKILPVKGRPVQAAELTEIQSIVQDNLKQGFDTIFRSGAPIKGLRVTVASRDITSVTVSISSGQIYIEGLILDVQGTNLTIPIDNIYDISISVTESIITEDDDSSLRDPVRGAFVLGTPGASRLTWTTSINFSSENNIQANSFAIAQIVNGIVIQKDLNPFYEVEKLMSSFIFERSGNFCVNGLITSSLGLQRRSSANITKFEQLQTDVTSATNEQQLALSNAVSFQQLVNTITQQVQEAQIQASISPTATNNATLSNLQNQLSDAQNNFNNFSNELVAAQINLDNTQNTLRNAETLLTDQQILSVSPGVSYIEGYRVALNSPSRLFIPQSLPTASVEAATFTFRGVVSQSLRQFSMSSGSSTIQTTDQYTSLEVNLTDIQVNANASTILSTNSFDVEILYKINDVTILSDIISTFISDINSLTTINPDITYTLRDSEAIGNPEITLDINGNTITQQVIKELLNNYVNISAPTTNSLLFSATNFTLDATNIIVDTSSKLYNKIDDVLVNGISNLLVNINNQTLSQPVSNSTYQLGFRPVIKVNRLVATLRTTQTVIRSQNDLSDTLTDDSVVQILDVRQTQIGTNNVTIFSPANYILVNQSQIQWRPGTVQPSTGTSYQVTFTYTEPLVQNTDYILNSSTDTIEFIGQTPAPNTAFTVDYTYSLAKAGVVTINKDGRVNYLLSAAARNPVIPTVPDSRLGIASFTLYSNRIEINQLDCRRQTVEDLYNLSERIRLNTKNNQQLKLDIRTLNQAVALGDDPIGVYTDAITDVSKIDTDLTNASIVPGVQGYMTDYNYEEDDIVTLTNGTTATVVKNELGIDSYAMLPYTEVLFLNQPRSTKTAEVTVFPTTINKRARLYSDSTYIFRNLGSSNVSPCDPITRAGNFFTAQIDNREFIQDIVTNVRTIIGPYGQQVMDSLQTGLPITVANTQNQDDFIVKAFNDIKAADLSINLHAEGLPAGIPGFKLFLNGDAYTDYVLIAGTGASYSINPNSTLLGFNKVLGIDGFTIKTDGTVDLRINLPNNLPTGTHTIEIKQEGRGYCKTNIHVFNNLMTHMTLTPLRAWNAIPISTSSSIYQPTFPSDVFSEDLSRLGIDPSLSVEIIDNTVSINETIEASYPDKHFTVNQTFVPSEDYFLTSVNLKIASQPTGNEDDMYVALTDANTDIPLKQIRSIATASSYTTTTLAFNNSGVYTKFTFDTPQQLIKDKKYNLGLESYLPQNQSDNFFVYSAVADNIDISTNSIIGEQLFLDGDMFLSPDGSSLNIADKEDLTMELYRADFQDQAVVNLGLYTGIKPTNFFCLNTRDIVPIGTDIIYEYKPAGSTNSYIAFKPNSVVCLNSPLAGIEIQARLLSNFSNISPMLLLNKSSISLYNNLGFSSVISKPIIWPSIYFKVTITIDYIQPAGTDIKVYYSPTRGFAWENPEWIELDEQPSSTILLDQDLQIYLAEERRRFRWRIDLTGDVNNISPIIKNVQSYVE